MQFGGQEGGVNGGGIGGTPTGGGGGQWVGGGGPMGGGGLGHAAPPPPQPAGLKSLIPGSAGYLAAMAAAGGALDSAKAEIAFNRNKTAGQYGYLLNSNGTIGGVDPNNPMGLYQQERKSEAASTLSALNAQRAGGWGGGGMIGQALQQAKSTIGMGMYNQGQQLGDTMHGYVAAGTQAQDTYNQALNTAYQNAWNAAVASGNYDPVTGQPIPGDTSGGSTGTTSGQGGTTGGSGSASGGGAAVKPSTSGLGGVQKYLKKRKK